MSVDNVNLVGLVIDGKHKWEIIEAAAMRKLSKYSTISQTHFHPGCFVNHETYQRRRSTLHV